MKARKAVSDYVSQEDNVDISWEASPYYVYKLNKCTTILLSN